MQAKSSEPRRRSLLLSAVLSLCPLAVSAQPGARVWRCGNHYTDQPCLSGTELTQAETPSESARRDADAATRRTREQADAMARDRERREATARGRPPAVIEHASPWPSEDEEDRKRPRSRRAQRPRLEKGRTVQQDAFTAKGPAVSKKSAR